MIVFAILLLTNISSRPKIKVIIELITKAFLLFGYKNISPIDPFVFVYAFTSKKRITIANRIKGIFQIIAFCA